ncbi:MAG: MBL fold metallo-hydrolase [Candidatus Flemingiibacterium sp.]
MRFQYLGTAAAEGIPALWCECEACRRSREIGGRALRTRSQAIIDGKLLIDFPADTYSHILKNNIDLLNVRDVLITHSHSDHLYPTDIEMLAPGFSHVPEGYHMSFYGSDKVGEAVESKLGSLRGLASFTEVKPFETFKAGDYTVTALPGVHDKKAGPLIYMISDGVSTVLYAHDTHFFCDEVWEFFESTKPRFDFVSLDCTNALTPLTYIGHMSAEENKLIRERFLSEGYADKKTIFAANHFSHNGEGVVYDDYVRTAAKLGFIVSYDGMVIDIK